jgi:hypothetical protein
LLILWSGSDWFFAGRVSIAPWVSDFGSDGRCVAPQGARDPGGFNGILQVDGYAAYKKLAAPTRPGGPVRLAYCRSHLRRQFYEVYFGGKPTAACHDEHAIVNAGRKLTRFSFRSIA